MKKLFTLSVLFTLISSLGFAQTTSQDFGTGTGLWNTSNSSSTAWLPNPLVSGTTWGRISNGQGGDIQMSNPGLAVLGSGSEVRASASTGASVVKVSPMVGYTVGNQFYTKFDMVLGDVSGGNTATTGSWSFFQGTTTSGFYADANDYAASKVFTGLRWTFAASGALTFQYLATSTWTTVSTFMTQGNKYTLEIFGSNSGGTINYTYGTAQTVADNKFDLWVNGVLVLDDVAKGQASNGATVDAVCFIGKSSTSNAANIFLDDFQTYNTIASVPPITPSCSTPTTNASAFTFSGTTTTQTTLNWTNGDGTNRIIVGRYNNNVAGTPTNATTYTGNTVFGTGGTIAANEYVVTNGFTNPITVTSLTPGAAYNFKIFEYNCTAGNEMYLTGSPASANVVMLPGNPGTFASSCSDLTTGDITLTWTLPAGFGDGFLIFANTASNTYVPSGLGTSYTGANANYPGATAYGGEKLVYSGTGTTVTVTGLTAGQTYYFRAYTHVVSTYSTGTAVVNSYIGVQNTSTPAVVSASGSLDFTWVNPACYDSIVIFATDNGASPTVTPTGDGSLYFNDFIYSNPGTEVNMPVNEFCIYRGTGTSMTVMGLTNAIVYRFKIYVRRGTTWSTGVTFNATATTQTGDYQTISSGQWNDNSIWQIWGTPLAGQWNATTANSQYPNLYTASVTINPGHIVTVPTTSPRPPPYAFKNLTISAGGKAYCNTSGNQAYFNVFQSIVNDGTLGNGATADGLGITAESAAVAIGGSGTTNLSRIKKSLSTGVATANSILIISMDIGLSYATGSNTCIFNEQSGSKLYVTVSAGSTVSTPAASGNISFDGVAGADAGTQRGQMTVNGTLNVNGTYYMTTNNVGAANGSALIINSGGIMNVNNINATASTGAATHTMTINSGGLLNIYGTGFTTFSTTNNVYTCNSGSTVEYSGTSAQTIESGFSYSNLTLSTGANNKTANGNLTVNGDLTVDVAILNVTTSLKTLNIGGDITLQNGGIMNDNCKTLLDIITNSNTTAQVFTGNSQLIKCLNLTGTKTSGSMTFTGPSGNTDSYIGNDLKLSMGIGGSLFTDNGNTFSIGDDAEMTGVVPSTFNLTGTLKFICSGALAATDVHISNYAGTGVCNIVPNNVTVDAAAGSLITAVTVYPTAGSQTLTINGNVAIQNSLFSTLLNPSNNTLNVKGNWTTYSAAGFTEGTGTVVFNGTSAQTITGAESFYKFDLNNSTGLTINNDVTIANELKLTNGKLTTGANKILVTSTAPAAVVSGAGNTNYTASWVIGNIRRSYTGTNGTYDFPVGNVAHGNLAQIITTGLTGPSYFDSYFRVLANGNAGQLVAVENGVTSTPPWAWYTAYTNINSGGCWVIEPNSQPSAGTYNVKLYHNGFTGLTDNMFAPLKRPIGSLSWANFGAQGGTINVGGGLGRMIADGYALRMGLTSFSEFGIGMSGIGLPVELTSFTGVNVGNDNILSWSTSSEMNSDHFELEHSLDAKDFTNLGNVSAAGTSVDKRDYNFTHANPASAINYYRLKLVDRDDTYKYSSIIAIDNTSSLTDVLVFPNPTLDNWNFQFTNSSSENAEVVMTDVIGKIIFKQKVNLSEGINSFSLEGNNLSAGTYLVTIHHIESGKIETFKLNKSGKY